jgi:hypothetical protein
MSCSAVGTWLITDWKREIEQSRDVELARMEEFEQRFADNVRCVCADIPEGGKIDVLHDLIAVRAAQLIAAFLADERGSSPSCRRGRSGSRSMRSRAARTICVLKPPHRPRSLVITTSNCTWSLPVPRSSSGALSPDTAAARLAITRAIRLA